MPGLIRCGKGYITPDHISLIIQKPDHNNSPAVSQLTSWLLLTTALLVSMVIPNNKQSLLVQYTTITTHTCQVAMFKVQSYTHMLLTPIILL